MVGVLLHAKPVLVWQAKGQTHTPILIIILLLVLGCEFVRFVSLSFLVVPAKPVVLLGSEFGRHIYDGLSSKLAEGVFLPAKPVVLWGVSTVCMPCS